jgi:hypothetical protein
VVAADLPAAVRAILAVDLPEAISVVLTARRRA